MSSGPRYFEVHLTLAGIEPAPILGPFVASPFDLSTRSVDTQLPSKLVKAALTTPPANLHSTMFNRVLHSSAHGDALALKGASLRLDRRNSPGRQTTLDANTRQCTTLSGGHWRKKSAQITAQVGTTSYTALYRIHTPQQRSPSRLPRSRPLESSYCRRSARTRGACRLTERGCYVCIRADRCHHRGCSAMERAERERPL